MRSSVLLERLNIGLTFRLFFYSFLQRVVYVCIIFGRYCTEFKKMVIKSGGAYVSRYPSRRGYNCRETVLGIIFMNAKL